MTTQELQDFAKEIGATFNLWPASLTIKTRDCTVCVHVNLDRTYDRRKIARLLVDKIEAVFCPSEDLLALKEQLEGIK